jgi:hypothetical protein
MANPTDPKVKQARLTAWREEHPGQLDPDDAALQRWLADIERKDFLEQWREAHPRQTPPRRLRRGAPLGNQREKQASARLHTQERGKVSLSPHRTAQHGPSYATPKVPRLTYPHT